jgi:hypothetical protein
MSSTSGLHATPSSSCINNNHKEEDINIETINYVIPSTAVAKPKF